MLVGMGTVFFFLTLLVFVTQLMSRAVQRFFPAMIEKAAPGSGSNTDEEVAAIAAAISLHRRR